MLAPYLFDGLCFDWLAHLGSFRLRLLDGGGGVHDGVLVDTLGHGAVDSRPTLLRVGTLDADCVNGVKGLGVDDALDVVAFRQAAPVSDLGADWTVRGQ